MITCSMNAQRVLPDLLRMLGCIFVAIGAMASGPKAI